MREHDRSDQLSFRRLCSWAVEQVTKDTARRQELLCHVENHFEALFRFAREVLDLEEEDVLHFLRLWLESYLTGHFMGASAMRYYCADLLRNAIEEVVPS